MTNLTKEEYAKLHLKAKRGLSHRRSRRCISSTRRSRQRLRG